MGPSLFFGARVSAAEHEHEHGHGHGHGHGHEYEYEYEYEPGLGRHRARSTIIQVSECSPMRSSRAGVGGVDLQAYCRQVPGTRARWHLMTVPDIRADRGAELERVATA